MKIYGGLEAGGTKFVCLAGTGPDAVAAETRFPCTTPEETLAQAVEFFAPFARRGELAAVGIGSFGPVDLNPDSPAYGFITTTPKAGWRQTDIRGTLARALRVPVAFDTDVNAAAFGEQYWVPQNRDCNPLAYMTVGTGIGVGIIVNGSPLHGLVHCEGGHLAIPQDRGRDPFAGVCPFHGGCLEGLASGPALERRWGRKPEELPADHPAWELEADYLALALANLIYTLSPQRLVLGGGVSQHPGLLPLVRRRVQKLLQGYIQSPRILEDIDSYIVPPALGNRSGSLGAVALAMTRARQ